MESIKNILTAFKPTEDKYITRDYQAFGIYLAQKLQDSRHKAFYIRLAKHIHKPVLENALRFVIDSSADNLAALFMWKLKEMKVFKTFTIPMNKRKKAVNKKDEKEIEDVVKKVRKPRKSKQNQDEMLF